MSSKNKYKNKQNQVEEVSQSKDVIEEVVKVEEEKVPVVEFDSWWALRSPQIPRHHHKEIIKADF